MKREQLVSTVFDNMTTFKRGLHGSMELFIKGLPVSRAQLELLFTIQHLEPVSSKQLADHLQLTPGAVSQLLDGLTDQGFVERHVTPNDRRVQRLKLSLNGAKLLAGIEKGRRKYMERVMQHLSDQELAVWVRIQQKLIDELQKSNKHDKGDAHEV